MISRLLTITLLLYTGSIFANTSVVNNSTNESSISQSPVLSLGGSATNTIIDNETVASTRFDYRKKDGTMVSYAGTCPSATLYFTGSYGQNDIETRPTWSESRGDSAAVVAGVAIPFGPVVNSCEEMIDLGSRSASISFSQLLIDSCIAMAKSGLSYEVIAMMNDEFKQCERIYQEAAEGFHGPERQTIVLQSKAIENLEKKNEELKHKNDHYRNQLAAFMVK
ncbi:hypothetical protein [Vibrio phage BONAISHI]|nr:hypothetical protein [Vibrio phage BONAISHI]